MPLEDFIELPDTASFIIRYTPLAANYITEHPNIHLGKVLVGGYAIIYVQRDQLRTVMEELGPWNASLVLGLLSQFDLESSGITQVQQQPYLSLLGDGVLLAFIDTGIDYTKEAFQHNDGTSKIQYIWDQTIRGNAPEDFPFGTEYTNAQINEALRSPDPLLVVPHEDTDGHGTFLASVAASHEEGMYRGAAPNADLIVVKLKKASPFYLEQYLILPEQQNAYETSDLMLGIEYALEKAIELDRPIAICIALGTNLGGHDGFNIIEHYLSRISYITGVALCIAAGNESSTRHHTQGVITQTGETKNIEIRNGSSDRDIYINLWNNVSSRLSVSVKSPTGEVVGRVPARSGTTLESRLILERSTVVVQYLFPVEGSGAQSTVIKILNPTPGIWTLTLYGDIILEGTYNIWLPLTGFADPQVEFLAAVPDCTITVPATALGPITCGAYNSRNNSLYISSSWGPTRRPTMAPDFVAPGVDVGGIYPRGYGEMSGTGVATAITAGAAALLLQWGIVEGNNRLVNTNLIKSLLISGCDRDPDVQYPSVQWGYGRMNLLNSFESLRTT